MQPKPRLLITMGDPAGVGPEIIVAGWASLHTFCRPIVVGDSTCLNRACTLLRSGLRVRTLLAPEESAEGLIPCISAGGLDVEKIQPGKITAEGGRAAYDFLCKAIDLTMAGEADAIVTAPLHKEGLHLAGLDYPGHTEILAERTGTKEFGMMLFGEGLGVVHVTLHMALRYVFEHVTTASVFEKIKLLNDLMPRLLGRPARLGVAALNPHASDGGIFGSEEREIIEPAVAQARALGIAVTGPWPSDTMFVRARKGELDGLVAMYHDQGHIAFKLFAGLRAVNISVGLPIIRTSVAHGTAYDIAGKGIADPISLIEAARVAAKLAASSPRSRA